jgi:hypothetical protein
VTRRPRWSDGLWLPAMRWRSSPAALAKPVLALLPFNPHWTTAARRLTPVSDDVTAAAETPRRLE